MEDIEWEATFVGINLSNIRDKLNTIGATLKRKKFMQKRVNFELPKGHEKEGAWIRVRDEGDKVTLAYKRVSEKEINNIENQKEIQLEIDDFKTAENFLVAIGCKKSAYQESYRELWVYKNIEITFDEWPFLEPYIEIEGKCKKDIENFSKLLGLNFKDAKFVSSDFLYAEKYGVSLEFVNNIPRLCFKDKNPFI